MRYLLLILVGGPTAMTVPILVARHLVYRHADEYAVTARRQRGEAAVRDAAQLAAGRDNLAAGIHRALAARESAR